MAPAKPIALHVRASQVSHLCFESGGVLGQLNAELGEQAPHFDFGGFYATLGSMPSVPGHPARLIYDFPQIDAFTAKFALATLRAETSRTALNRAVNARANAFYAKYADAPTVISRMHEMYSPMITGSKPNRLDILASLSEQQMLMLRDAYLTDKRTDVVRTTESQMWGSQTANVSGFSNEVDVSFSTDSKLIQAPLNHAQLTSITNPQGRLLAQSDHMEFDEHDTRGSEMQTVLNTDYGYRTPHLENLAQYERAQISLIDEQFSQFMSGQNLPYLAAVFSNELQMIDSDVYRLQIAYLNSILMSPIRGSVTGIYKHPGDAVQAGEPVIRVEDNDEIFVVATVVFPGPIAIGASFEVTTHLFSGGPSTTTVKGKVVSVRGVEEDDHWDIIAACSNLDSGGARIFPLGYHFDFDDTTISIS